MNAGFYTANGIKGNLRRNENMKRSLVNNWNQYKPFQTINQHQSVNLLLTQREFGAPPR